MGHGKTFYLLFAFSSNYLQNDDFLKRKFNSKSVHTVTIKYLQNGKSEDLGSRFPGSLGLSSHRSLQLEGESDVLAEGDDGDDDDGDDEDSGDGVAEDNGNDDGNDDGG